VLGARELDSSDWPPGSVIDAAADESEFRVVRQLDYERDGEPEWLTVLVVEPADE